MDGLNLEYAGKEEKGESADMDENHAGHTYHTYHTDPADPDDHSGMLTLLARLIIYGWFEVGIIREGGEEENVLPGTKMMLIIHIMLIMLIMLIILLNHSDPADHDDHTSHIAGTEERRRTCWQGRRST